MSFRTTSASLILAALAVPMGVGCSGPSETTNPGAGGSTTGGAGGTGAGTGGSAGTGTGATGGTGGAKGGAAGSGGSAGAATGGGAGAATGGGAGAATGGSAGAATGGSAGAATGGGGSGMSGAGGTGGTGGSAGTGTGGMPMIPPLDCGGKGTVVENHGPPANRVNYVIVGDGYSEAELDTTLDDHIEVAMEKRFRDPIGQVYLRYRNFVNICVLKIPSTPICGSSTFGCCGDDESRLAHCDEDVVNAAIRDNMPETFEVDWRATVLNGDSWWNTGASLMLWSGGHEDAAGAALHEGGHGFHRLADEYGNCGSGQVNVTNDDTTSGGKWDAWIGFDQQPGTGEQGFFACEGNQNFRPSDNSMMNMLFGDDPDTSFNAVSREKMIMDIWLIIDDPWDAVNPPAGAVMNPATLSLQLIDPAVTNVDWSVDGNVVMMNGGQSFNVGTMGLAPGSHMVSARVYDNAGMDLVRQTTGMQYNRQAWATKASKTVTWTVTIP